MKKLKRIIPLILTAICLLVMPMNAKGLDFGNYAGEEDFGYDSNWKVEQNTTAPQYTADGSDSSGDGCFSCDGCTMCKSKSEMKFRLLAILACGLQGKALQPLYPYAGRLAEQGYLGAPPVYDGRILRSDEAPA